MRQSCCSETKPAWIFLFFFSSSQYRTLNSDSFPPAHQSEVGNDFWLVLSAPDGSADNFSEAKDNMWILGDVFSPIYVSLGKLGAGWCFLCGPLTHQCSFAGKCCFIRQDVFNLMLLSDGERCISRVRLFCSALTYFTVFCHILFLPLNFPKSLVTTINLCLGGCSSLLSIPQIVHLPWTLYISNSFFSLPPLLSKSTARNQNSRATKAIASPFMKGYYVPRHQLSPQS